MMNVQKNMPDTAVKFNAESGDIEHLRHYTEQTLDPRNLPLCAEIMHQIPIYDGKAVDKAAHDVKQRSALLYEWTQNFERGSGIIVIKSGINDPVILDIASEIFVDIFEEEKKNISASSSDNASKTGNAIIWNGLEKHCLFDAGNFASYFASNTIAMAAEAWLGPNYQLTSQIKKTGAYKNNEAPHHDYHFGYMATEQAIDYPAHVHRLSAALTLQGIVAHSEMSDKNASLQLLPFSHQYDAGFIAVKRPEFQDYFTTNSVSLPLEKGDMVFFNPAIMHASAETEDDTDIALSNWLQISSAFGRAMETIDRKSMSQAVFPVLASLKAQNKISERDIDNVIAACAEGYAFPTNLDNDPPAGGRPPKTQAEYLKQAVLENWTATDLEYELIALTKRQNSRKL